MLCIRVYFTLNLLDGFPHIPLILVQGDDEASAPFSPYGIDVGSYRTVRTCIGLGTGRVQSPCGVGGVEQPLPRLAIDYVCVFQLLVQLLRVHSYLLGDLCAGQSVHALQVVVVVVDFRSSFLDFLVLQFDGGLLLLGFNTQLFLFFSVATNASNASR